MKKVTTIMTDENGLKSLIGFINPDFNLEAAGTIMLMPGLIEAILLVNSVMFCR